MLDLVRERSHGLFRDDAALTASERGFSKVNGGKNLRATAFASFPERECLVDSFLFMLNPAGLDGVASEGFLVWAEVNVHGFEGRKPKGMCQQHCDVGAAGNCLDRARRMSGWLLVNDLLDVFLDRVGTRLGFAVGIEFGGGDDL